MPEKNLAEVKSETVVVTCENEQNAEYLRMLDKSIKELEKGNFVVRTMAELEAYES